MDIVFQCIEQGFQLTKKHWKVFAIPLIITILFSLVGSFGGNYGGSGSSSSNQQNDSSYGSFSNNILNAQISDLSSIVSPIFALSAGVLIIIFVAILIISLILSWVEGGAKFSMFRTQNELIDKGTELIDFSWFSEIFFGIKKFIPIWFARLLVILPTLILVLLVLVAFITSILPAKYIPQQIAQYNNLLGPFAFILLLLAFVFFIIHSLILILIMFAPYEYVINGRGLVDSLIQSKQLVFSNFGIVFIYVMFWYFISLASAFASLILSVGLFCCLCCFGPIVASILVSIWSGGVVVLWSSFSDILLWKKLKQKYTS
ncbi:hypothetical protein KO465_01175 [Candidatus Micrarchaeota archaeon]|nr:hypothetical protein [Candidatus Micrarchaeota archaeon]